MTKDEMLAYLRLEESHLDCEDCWYSCAKLTCDDKRKSDTCDCGADRRNAISKEIADALEAAAVPEGRDTVIEECAKVCENNMVVSSKTLPWECAALIRALKQSSPQPQPRSEP